MTPKEKAEELLNVLCNSKSHNPAWALQEVLDKLCEHLKPDALMSDYSLYELGHRECVEEIRSISKELEQL
jgi:CheY-like chemotaxis protein